MRQKTRKTKKPDERIVRDIRRAARRNIQEGIRKLSEMNLGTPTNLTLVQDQARLKLSVDHRAVLNGERRHRNALWRPRLSANFCTVLG